MTTRDATRRAAERARVTSLVGERLLGAPWLRRLARISFLGTLDAHPQSRRRSDRWAHTLGVAAFAERAGRDLAFGPDDLRLFVACALVHDVGHFPLSHAAEHAFAELVGADHHGVAAWIICGRGPIRRAASLAPELERIGVDPELVWCVLEGRAATPAQTAMARLLSAPINVDTLEGITRVAADFGLRHRVPAGRLFCWDGNAPALRPQAVSALDDFWRLKAKVYEQIIERPSNVLAEARLSRAVRAHYTQSIAEQLDALDDAHVQRTLAGAWESVRLRGSDDDEFALRARTAARSIAVRVRKRYVVDGSVRENDDPLPVTAWPRRYRHRRERSHLVLAKPQLTLPWADPSAGAWGALPETRSPDL